MAFSLISIKMMCLSAFWETETGARELSPPTPLPTVPSLSHDLLPPRSSLSPLSLHIPFSHSLETTRKSKTIHLNPPPAAPPPHAHKSKSVAAAAAAEAGSPGAGATAVHPGGSGKGNDSRNDRCPHKGGFGLVRVSLCQPVTV